ncbi:partial argininosuccinate lyase, partial [uncultured bacterium]
MTLWGGRFSEPSDDDLRALNDSLPYDKRLYREDIRGSIVYALALVKAGVITKAEAQQIEQGLEQVLAEFEADTFALKPEDEDIHTAVERRLTEIIGETGGKLHTGRSRNDQIATDMRLWVRREMVGINNRLLPLQEALVEQAAAHVEDVMPGYTHMQPAQPVTAGHWLMSYFWMLQRDRTRVDVSIIHAEELPLGSGALAGTPLDIDRMVLGFNSELQFEGYTQNSLDAVSDRDFVADSLYALSMIGIHLSRLAEDLIIFSNPLFGFVTLDDRYSTGSSLMPQKRNPDPMELMRGKTGRLIGNLTGFLTTLKGLPTGYNKDLQEDKEALFDSVDTMNK